LRLCRGFRRRPLDRQRRGRRGGAGRSAHRRAIRALPLPQGAHLRGKNPLGDARRLRRSSRTQEKWLLACLIERKRMSNGQKPDPCSIIIFGVTGDLAHRLVIPALYNLSTGKLLPENFCIVGIARKGMTSDQLRDSLMEGLHKYSARRIDE